MAVFTKKILDDSNMQQNAITKFKVWVTTTIIINLRCYLSHILYKQILTKTAVINGRNIFLNWALSDPSSHEIFHFIILRTI